MVLVFLELGCGRGFLGHGMGFSDGSLVFWIGVKLNGFRRISYHFGKIFFV